MSLFFVLLLLAPMGWMNLFSFSTNAVNPPDANLEEATMISGLSSFGSDEPLLIWDNDGGDQPDGLNGCESFINDSLASNGYQNITISAQGENLTAFNLTNYTVVFIVLGMGPGTGNISAPEMAELTAFLDNGGRLYVEGGDIGFQAEDASGSGEYANLWPYLGAQYQSNGTNQEYVVGCAPVITQNLSFAYTGDNASMDEIGSANGGFEILNNSGTGFGIANNKSYRTVLFTFQFGGLVDWGNFTTKDELMRRLMHFFAYEKKVDISVGKENLPTASFTDFETESDEGWTHGIVQGNIDCWERGLPTSGPNSAHSGTNVWATDLSANYLDFTDCALYMPRVDLFPNSKLEFWHWYNIERGWDFGQIEVQSQPGGNWQMISSFTGQSNGWVKETISIPNQFSGNVQIRFRIITDFIITAPGWYIDDIGLISDNGMFDHDDGYFVSNEVEIEPNVTVKNEGNVPAAFDLRARVYNQNNGTEVYNQSVLVNLTPRETMDVGFPQKWNTSTDVNATYIMEFMSLANEENGTDANNVTSFWIYVGIFTDLASQDVMFNVSDPFLPGINLTPKGKFLNLGNANISAFTASLKITDTNSTVIYWQNVSGNYLNLSWGNSTIIEFPVWQVPNGEDDYLVNLSHDFVDKDSGNDIYRTWVKGEEYYDAMVEEVLFNVSLPLNSSDVVNITVPIVNNGNIDALNFAVTCVVLNQTGSEIYNATNASVSVGLPNGNITRVAFDNIQLPSEEGDITVIIIITWPNDENQSNNLFMDDFPIDDHHDVGFPDPLDVQIVGEKQYDYFPLGPREIRTNIANFGNVNQTPTVRFDYAIEGPPRYLFFDDVEGSVANDTWTKVNFAGGQSQFHVVEPNSPHSDFHSPDHSWWLGQEATGDYADNNDAELICTRMDLRGETEATLNFWHDFKIAQDDILGIAYSLTSLDDPPNGMWQWYANWQGGNSGGWTQATYDLTPFAGQEFLLGFVALTQDNAGVPTVDDGWYIDDINITGPNPIVIDSHFVQAPELAPGQNATVTDVYDFQQNNTYFILPTTVLQGDENVANNDGYNTSMFMDFYDLSPTSIEVQGARTTFEKLDLSENDGGLIPGGRWSFEWGLPTNPTGPLSTGFNDNCWAVNLDSDYREHQDITLTYMLDLKNYTGAQLTFDHWYLTEEGNDGLWLEIKNGTNDDYLNLTPLGGYPSFTKVPWDGTRIPAYSGKSGFDPFFPEWRQPIFNISEYVGYVVEIRFHFCSDNVPNDPGWFMTNLSVIDPYTNAWYRMNSGEDCTVNFDFTNLGNIPSIQASAHLNVRGITDPGYSYQDTITISGIDPLALESDVFTTPWTPPAVEGLYWMNITLDIPNDLKPENSEIGIIVEVEDFHALAAKDILLPIENQAYALGDTIGIGALVRNWGTHPEQDVDVEIEIVDIDNASWAPVVLTDTLDDIPLKEDALMEFDWTIPDRLGARYMITLTVTHPLDENATDNVYSHIFYGLHKRSANGLFGFIVDNSSDSPYYSQALSGVDVLLVSRNTGDLMNTTQTDELGYYYFDLWDQVPGREYWVYYQKDWYYRSTYLLSLMPRTVYRMDMEMESSNLLPIARLMINGGESMTHYFIDNMELEFDFSSTLDNDDPGQMLTYRLESDISGLLFQGENDSFVTSLVSGSHNITLTVSDEMGGFASTSTTVISMNTSWKSYNIGVLTVELLCAGPGAIIIENQEVMPHLPAGYVDIHEDFHFNLKIQGDFFIEGMIITMTYTDDILHHNAYETDLGIFVYYHRPQTRSLAGWSELEVIERDFENNTLSVLNDNRTWQMDIDISMMAPEDVTPPAVLETVPVDKEKNASIYTDIYIVFSEPIQFNLLKKSDMTVKVDVVETKDYSLRYNDTERTLYIVMDSHPLDPNEKYSVKIDRVFDLVGNALEEITFSFRTKEPAVLKEKVHGYVRDKNLNPLSGASLLVDGDMVAVTDDWGYFSFYIQAGTYILTANRSGYLDRTYDDLKVELGRVADRSFILEKFMVYDMVEVRGTVTNEDGRALGGVNIYLGEAGGSLYWEAKSNASGGFRFDTIYGSYQVVFRRDGFRDLTIDFDPINQTEILDVVMSDDTLLRIIVKDEDGNLLERAEVSIQNGPTVVETGTTDAMGFLELDGILIPGTYIIVFKADGYKEARRTGIELSSGNVTEVQINLKAEAVSDDGDSSSALSLIGWILFIIVLIIVVLLVIIVARRPAVDGKEESIDDNESADEAEPESDLTEGEGGDAEPSAGAGTEEVIGDGTGAETGAQEYQAPQLGSAPIADEKLALDDGAQRDLPALPSAPVCPSCGMEADFRKDTDSYWCKDCKEELTKDVGILSVEESESLADESAVDGESTEATKEIPADSAESSVSPQGEDSEVEIELQSELQDDSGDEEQRTHQDQSAIDDAAEASDEEAGATEDTSTTENPEENSEDGTVTEGEGQEESQDINEDDLDDMLDGIMDDI